MKKLIRKLIPFKHRVQILKFMNYGKNFLFQMLDIVLAPVTLIYTFFLKQIRLRRFRNLPLTKAIMFKIGVFPIIDHYFEPLYNPKHLKRSLRLDRQLPGINWNVKEQLEILDRFQFNDELIKFPIEKDNDKIEFCYDGGPFQSGDAEYLFNMIRLFKPAKIIEIGSGYSTLMAINATKANQKENPDYQCEHICIEPFENSWLEECNITIVRKLVEDMPLSLFKSLGKNDILFIDSTHIIRPQGDVLFEYLEVIPLLNSGVIIHIHDIFSPKDYPDEWINNSGLWNEQYLLEAFLTMNNQFSIIGATNYLMHNHYESFSSKCPVLKSQPQREPGSFWIRKN
jgi:predicted O-methyltransferase YrrM